MLSHRLHADFCLPCWGKKLAFRTSRCVELSQIRRGVREYSRPFMKRLAEIGEHSWIRESSPPPLEGPVWICRLIAKVCLEARELLLNMVVTPKLQRWPSVLGVPFPLSTQRPGLPQEAERRRCFARYPGGMCSVQIRPC
jgi:hypothetical protein